MQWSCLIICGIVMLGSFCLCVSRFWDQGMSSPAICRWFTSPLWQHKRYCWRECWQPCSRFILWFVINYLGLTYYNAKITWAYLFIFCFMIACFIFNINQNQMFVDNWLSDFHVFFPKLLPQIWSHTLYTVTLQVPITGTKTP